VAAAGREPPSLEKNEQFFDFAGKTIFGIEACNKAGLLSQSRPVSFRWLKQTRAVV